MSACLQTIRDELDRTAAQRLLRDIEPSAMPGGQPCRCFEEKLINFV